MNPDPATVGLAAALGAAVLWAGGTVLYGRAGRAIPPTVLNAAKGVAVSVAFAATLWVGGVPFVGQVAEAERWRLGLLAASGVVGIAAGDSFYFASINAIGAHRAAMVFLVSTPMAVALGWAALGEAVTPVKLLGIGLVFVGVVVVVRERGGKPGRPVADEEGAVPTRAYAAGVGLGLLAAAGQAGGAVLNRRALDGADGLNPLASALFRLGVSTLCLLAVLPLLPRRWRRVGGGGITWRVVAIVAVAALLGTYGGLWLQQEAFARAKAGPVQTMLSTTPVWILPIAALAGERVGVRAVVGAVVAVAGVGLMVLV